MGGASRRHGLVAMAMGLALGPRARERGCQLFIADMKVRVDHQRDSYFYYPDLLLSRDPDDRHELYCDRPCLIVEVLSPGTERIDRREKRLAYSLIPSLREYMLVDPNQPLVERFHRPDPNGSWRHEALTEGLLRLDCLDMTLSLTDIYADVTFESESR